MSEDRALRRAAGEPHLVPANKAAERLGRHVVTMRRDLRDGTVPGVQIGSRWYVSSLVLDRLLGIRDE